MPRVTEVPESVRARHTAGLNGGTPIDSYFMFEGHTFLINHGPYCGHSQYCGCFREGEYPRRRSFRMSNIPGSEQLQAACKVMYELREAGINLIDGLNMLLDPGYNVTSNETP